MKGVFEVILTSIDNRVFESLNIFESDFYIHCLVKVDEPYRGGLSVKFLFSINSPTDLFQFLQMKQTITHVRFLVTRYPKQLPIRSYSQFFVLVNTHTYIRCS